MNGADLGLEKDGLEAERGKLARGVAQQQRALRIDDVGRETLPSGNRVRRGGALPAMA
jgi:hypothetical protein